jgi:glutamate N-acetyltransferase/amino-acid N-acetyltransferase
MKTSTFTPAAGSILAPKGFSAAGVFCDIKRLGTGKGSAKGPKRDLAIITSSSPATVAGMFTTNQICAAPVKLCVERVANGTAQAIVVNSGNANACTGDKGLKDAQSMARETASKLHLDENLVLVASTGRIGVNLPMPRVRQGIQAAAKILSPSAESANHVAEAILTSDTHPKQIAVSLQIGGQTVHIGGICKGAGMIQPGMSPSGKRPASSALHATMLGFLTTDAQIDRKTLQNALTQAVALSFNRITVDGDMSTNDTVLILANGQASNPPLSETKAKRNSACKTDLQTFQTALNHVCLELAKMIVRDGEGVHRVVTLHVQGARSQADAEAAARAVANSALVKTSWHGGDPNWGRIIDALGYSPATVVENKVDIGYGSQESNKIVWSLKNGQPTRTSFKTLCTAVAPNSFELHIHLNLGQGQCTMIAADLTEAYVDFNKGDVSDPASLGG